jgi:predicted hydrocarbon binding protein
LNIQKGQNIGYFHTYGNIARQDKGIAMTKTDINMIKELGKTVERFAGKTASDKVMQDCKHLTKSSSKENIALWVRAAIYRLDSTVDEETRKQIMEHCGRNCASINKKVVESAKKRRKKFKDVSTFLEAEIRKPMKGTRLRRDGDTLFQYYTPHSFTQPMRCYCSLLRGLPDETTISLTYCHCSKAFVQKLWESVLEQPVTVDLLQSAVSGNSECKFAVHLPPKIDNGQ